MANQSQTPDEKTKNESSGFQPEQFSGAESEEKTESKEVSKEQEQTKETKEQKPQQEDVEETVNKIKQSLPSTKKKKKRGTSHIQDELTEEIEEIMEEGLKDAYKELTPVQKQEFKIKGEETAVEIRKLFKEGKAKVKQIFKLIFEWLKTLPGINKFFLEQEAKIKADKIKHLGDRHQDQN